MLVLKLVYYGEVLNNAIILGISGVIGMQLTTGSLPARCGPYPCTFVILVGVVD